MNDRLKIAPSINVLGEPLLPCSLAPMTGFFRDGCCNTCQQDTGSHTVCVELTELFLSFSKSRGNDLITPQPNFGFAGLKPFDAWCLCAGRWLEAYEAGVPPKVNLASTHQAALEIVPLEYLLDHAVIVN
ncbi:MAG: DUF2237 domain-containing protein [Proteobacteria bacterium]|nr:DUF2237 domain-containing protein [Pseudomonadota bacterium]